MRVIGVIACVCVRARARAHVQINILIIGIYLPYVYHSIFKYFMKLVQENIMWEPQRRRSWNSNR